MEKKYLIATPMKWSFEPPQSLYQQVENYCISERTFVLLRLNICPKAIPGIISDPLGRRID